IGCGAAGLREQRLNFRRHWIEAGDWNLVAGELISDQAAHATHRPSGTRIVNHAFEHLTAERIGTDYFCVRKDRRAKVAYAIRRDGDGLKLVVDLGGLSERLKVEKEEGFVVAVIDLGNPHRAAQRKAIVVAARARTGITLRA